MLHRGRTQAKDELNNLRRSLPMFVGNSYLRLRSLSSRPYTMPVVMLWFCPVLRTG